MINRSNIAVIYRANLSGTCQYVSNYSFDYKANPSSISSMYCGISKSDDVGILPTKPLWDVTCLMTSLANGHNWFFVNSTHAPNVTISTNISTNFYGDRIEIKASINESICMNATAQLRTNLTGTLDLNETKFDAVSGGMTGTIGRNYSNLTVYFPLLDQRICSRPIELAIQACNGAGVCANSSSLVFYPEPFINVTSGSYDIDSVFSCSEKRINITAFSASTMSFKIRLESNATGGNRTCPYRFSDTDLWERTNNTLS